MHLSGEDKMEDDKMEKDKYEEYGHSDDYRRRKKRSSHGGPACPAKLGAPLKYYYNLCQQR